MGRYGRIGWFKPVRRRDREAALAALERVGLADLARRQIRMIEENFTASNLGVGGQNTHNRLRGNRFTRTGFADQRDRVARRNAERHIRDRGYRAAVQGKIDRQPVYGQQG